MRSKIFTVCLKYCKTSTSFLLFFILLLTTFISFMVGRYGISFSDLIHAIIYRLNHKEIHDVTVFTIIFNVRLPRIMAAIIVGASLSVSGATYQGLFRNPLVSPDILGASSGAGFGASLAILHSMSLLGVQLSAFFFGLIATLIVYVISNFLSGKGTTPLYLILTGMVVGTLFSSFTSIIKYVADPDEKLPGITFWLMGGLASVRMIDLYAAILPMVLGLIPIILLRWKLNILSFGEDEAKALGVDVGRMRIIFILSSTLLTASAVSLCGMVGWVGLVIPHISRMISGPNYLSLITASLFLGATFLLVVDNFARSALNVEIPLGILTALIGAPFFIYLLLKGRGGWE